MLPKFTRHGHSDYVHVLVAYNYLRGKDGIDQIRRLTNNPNLCVLLDSGAFIAHRTQKDIDLQEYMDFVREVGPELFGYFALDVIGDVDATLRNLETMREAGLTPWPVFQISTDRADFRTTTEGASVVGIGGLNERVWPWTRSARLSYLKMMREWSLDAGVGLHLLGYADPPVLEAFQPFSADSSTWFNGQRYGRVFLYAGRGKWLRLYRDNWRKKMTPEAELEITRAGYSVADLENPELWTNTRENSESGTNFLANLMARSWVKFSLEFFAQFTIRVFLVADSGIRHGNQYPLIREAGRILGRSSPATGETSPRRITKTRKATDRGVHVKKGTPVEFPVVRPQRRFGE